MTLNQYIIANESSNNAILTINNANIIIKEKG